MFVVPPKSGGLVHQRYSQTRCYVARYYLTGYSSSEAPGSRGNPELAEGASRPVFA